MAPSDRINVGLISCRIHGFSILRHHLSNEGVHCVALCDVDENVLKDRASAVNEFNVDEPRLYSDYRRMLELDEIDAVIIGTPDHWHCLNFVHGCEAGKDIYVEKPLAFLALFRLSAGLLYPDDPLISSVLAPWARDYF